MYVDSHFHMTYVIARMAGLAPADARIVAYAAQQVDDNFVIVRPCTLTFADGSTFTSRWSLLPIPSSAWNVEAVVLNILPSVIHDTWFMYHFIAPCFAGDGSLSDLVTTPATDDNGNPTNPTAWKLVEWVLTRKGQANSLHLLGAALHMFCDTYSHQQFHGTYDQYNRPTVDSAGNTVYGVTPPTLPLSATQQASSNSANNINEDWLWGLWKFGGAIGHTTAIDLPDRPCGTYDWTHLADTVPAGTGLTVSRDNLDQWMNCITAVYNIINRYTGGNATIAQAQSDALRSFFMDNQALFASEDYTGRAAAWLSLIRTGTVATPNGGTCRPTLTDVNGKPVFDSSTPSSLEPDFVDYIGMQWYIDALNQAAVNANSVPFVVPADAQAYYTGYYTEPAIMSQIKVHNGLGEVIFDRPRFEASDFYLFMDAIQDIHTQMTQFYAAASVARPATATARDSSGADLTEDDMIAAIAEAVDAFAHTRVGNLL